MPDSSILILMLLNLVLLSFLLALFFVWQQVKKEILSLKQAHRAEREINKKAILQLLDEIVDLADGQNKAPCSINKHGLTGPIADAVNYLMEQEYPDAFHAGAGH
ncbi:MAG: hypothetical protein HOM11_11235 [Methylococcales bacterium]|jgi:hypothetical protein|nr:hypothetical protein [Methylococcales bacterium]MBT7445366.1 hypothetical protein [Methylococcales bacterium]